MRYFLSPLANSFLLKKFIKNFSKEEFLARKKHEDKLAVYEAIYKPSRVFCDILKEYKDKKILGDYLRSRMKLKVGTYVTENHFNKYGRDTITISKISDGVYYFDFSV